MQLILEIPNIVFQKLSNSTGAREPTSSYDPVFATGSLDRNNLGKRDNRISNALAMIRLTSACLRPVPTPSTKLSAK